MSKQFDDRLDNFFKNYHDQGMKKWQEFPFKISTDQVGVEERQPEMTKDRITSLLTWAFTNHYLVKIQFKADKNGFCRVDFMGFIERFVLDDVLIMSHKMIKIGQISNVKLKKLV